MMRRVRGVFATTFTWGAAWAIGGLALGSLALASLRSKLPSDMLLSDVLIQSTLRWGLFGALSGAALAIIAARLARRDESFESIVMRHVRRCVRRRIPPARTPIQRVTGATDSHSPVPSAEQAE